jgi:uncharacterized protein YdgA (DUF945 family)
MSKTLTRAAAAVVVIGAAYVGASWWLGRQVELRHEALLDRAVRQLGVYKMSVAERRYERGLFSAQSTVVLNFSPPAMPGQNEPAHALRITLRDDIRHGPLVGLQPAAARIHTRLVQVEGLGDAVRQAFAKVAAPESDTLVGLGGEVTGRMVLPAGEVTDPDKTGNRIEWQQLTYDYALAADGKRVSGAFDWPHAGAELRVPKAPAAADGGESGALKMSMDALRFDAELQLPDDQSLIVPGQQSGTLGALDVAWRGPGQTAFESKVRLHDFRMESKTAQDGGVFNTDSLVHGQARIGGVDLKEIRLDGQLRRADTQVLSMAQQIVQQFGSTPRPDAANLPSGAVQALVNRVIDTRPELRTNFSATTTDGQTVQLGYGITISPSAADAPPALAGLPWQLVAMQHVQADATLRLPKIWLSVLAQMIGGFQGNGGQPGLDAGSLAQMADGFVGKGWLSKDGDAYAAKVAFGSGRLLLNDRPFNPLQP